MNSYGSKHGCARARLAKQERIILCISYEPMNELNSPRFREPTSSSAVMCVPASAGLGNAGVCYGDNA